MNTNIRPFSHFAFNVLEQPHLSSALNYFEHHYHILNKHIFLYILWYASEQYGRIHKQELKSLELAVYLWHDRIAKEFKFLLDTLEKNSTPLSSKIKKLLMPEIRHADKYELELLTDVRLKDRKVTRTDLQRFIDGCYNVLTYFKYLCIRMNSEDEQRCVEILQAAFSYLAPQEIVENFNKAILTFKSNEVPFSQLSF